jgi:hypothetical protein
METLIAFSLGMVSAIAIVIVGVMVKLYKDVKGLVETVSHQETANDDIYRLIGQEVSDLQRQLDSRLDKLESKLTSKTLLKG